MFVFWAWPPLLPNRRAAALLYSYYCTVVVGTVVDKIQEGMIGCAFTVSGNTGYPADNDNDLKG